MSVFDPHKPGRTVQQTAGKHADTAAAIRRQMEEADADGNYQAVLEIADGFSSRYPNHPDTAIVYCLAAQAMHRGFGQTQDALALLDRLAASYPDEPQIAVFRASITEETA